MKHGIGVPARPMNSWEHNVMWEDPIVAEVHRIREKLTAQYNYDISAFFADVRKRQAALGERLIRKKPVEPTADADQGHPSDSATTSSEAIPAAEL
jgi:hypothetical protein